MTQVSHLTIKDLATKFDCTLRTLRFYEQKGLLEPIRVGAHRRYTDKDAMRLAIILRGKRFGFSLEAIRVLLLEAERQNKVGADGAEQFVSLLPEQTIVAQIAVLTRRQAEVEKAIEELQGAIACGCAEAKQSSAAQQSSAA